MSDLARLDTRERHAWRYEVTLNGEPVPARTAVAGDLGVVDVYQYDQRGFLLERQTKDEGREPITKTRVGVVEIRLKAGLNPPPEW